MPTPTKDHPYDCQVTSFELDDGRQRVQFNDLERNVSTFSTYSKEEVDAAMTIYMLPRGAAVLALAIGDRRHLNALAKPLIETKEQARAEIKREIAKWQEGA